MIEEAHILLNADEPCWGMAVFEDDSGFCTKLTVQRNGLPVNLVIHHGPSPEYSGKIPPMYVPSPDGENNVGLMLDMSEHHRQDLRWWLKAEEYRSTSTLIRDAIEQDERVRRAIRGQSVFGPHQTTQRNPAYSHQTTLREWWQERARITGQSKSFRRQTVRP